MGADNEGSWWGPAVLTAWICPPRMSTKKMEKMTGEGASEMEQGKAPPPVPQKEVEPQPLLGKDTANLTVGCPKESYRGERRVAISPANVSMLIQKEGYNVVIEQGAGESAGFNDSDYLSAGASLVDKAEAFGADIVLKVRSPGVDRNGVDEVELLQDGSTLISFVQPKQNQDLVGRIKDRGVNLFAMDMMPRTSRAQTYDALSSMASIAGYKAVIEAANKFGRYFTGQMTAAGKVPPAKMLVIGAGVAGLQAIQTAKNMGAIVKAFDTRNACKEQVESMGASFLTVNVSEEVKESGGYTQSVSERMLEAELILFGKIVPDMDIVITTANIPGREAPKLITEEMVRSMKAGSVIVDLAAESGGNTEVTQKDKEVLVSGVNVLGYTDLPSRLATQSSTLYSNNICKFLASFGAKERFHINLEDDLIRGTAVCMDREILPPVPPKAAPPPPAAKEKPEELSPEEKKEQANRELAVSMAKQMVAVTAGLGGLLAVGIYAPPTILPSVTTFSLATMIGHQVVTSVDHSLHSPLMSATNAISGSVIISATLLMGGGYLPHTPAQMLASSAVLISSMNIFGGFRVTQRMLDMFRRPDDPPSHASLYAIPTVLFGAGFLAAHFNGVQGLTQVAYLAASTFCIASIGGLSSQKTANAGNALGIAGVGTGLLATLASLTSTLPHPVFSQMAALITMGGALGYGVAEMVGPTELPQMIAGYHSCVGLAAVLVSFSSFLVESGLGALGVSQMVPIYLGSVIGGITFTGSIVAFSKLQGLMNSRALALPGRDAINIAGGLSMAGGMYAFITAANPSMGLIALSVGTGVSMLLGWHMTDSIGGADMPVAITVLNSYSGWALVTEGFLMNNNMLIITGSLIGASGALLTASMCQSMNRSILAVIFGGYGNGPQRAIPAGQGPAREFQQTNVDEVVNMMCGCKDIIIVPGYGLAVARGQYKIAEMSNTLAKHGVRVRYAIHPVAGRMPGQLNVLLAEAGVRYEDVFELADINGDFERADLVLVVGANDIVNSSAINDPESPIAGMQVLHVWNASKVVFMKRTMGSGYAGVENPVFFNENTSMLFGDAKDVCTNLNSQVSTYFESDNQK